MISCLFIVSLSACDRKEGETQPSEGDYLVFGRFYGECRGNACLEIFKLESDRLLEDTKTNYFTQTNYYEYDFGERHKAWTIDQTQADVPNYLHKYMDQVNETINALNR